MTKSIEMAVGVYQSKLLLEKLFAGNFFERNAVAKRLYSIIDYWAERAVKENKIRLHEKKDLIQEVWARLLNDNGKVLKKYDPGRGMSVESYSTMIVNREIGDIIRKHQSNKRKEQLNIKFNDDIYLEHNPLTIERFIQARELAVKLDYWLCSELTDRGITVLHAAFYEDAHPGEVAKHLNMSIKNVYIWRHKLRALSRRFLETECSFEKKERKVHF